MLLVMFLCGLGVGLTVRAFGSAAKRADEQTERLLAGLRAPTWRSGPVPGADDWAERGIGTTETEWLCAKPDCDQRVWETARGGRP